MNDQSQEFSSLLRGSRAPLSGVRWLHALRLTVFASVALAAFALFRHLCAPPVDLALGKNATASSQAFDTTPAGAVDGNRYGQLGFHSAKEASPWLRIDLGGATRLDTITVFGRADCCFDQSLPLVLEVSSDDRTYLGIAERTEPFSQYQPWQVEPKLPPVARFLRLRTTKESYLVVSEVEVNGRAVSGN